MYGLVLAIIAPGYGVVADDHARQSGVSFPDLSLLMRASTASAWRVATFWAVPFRHLGHNDQITQQRDLCQHLVAQGRWHAARFERGIEMPGA